MCHRNKDGQTDCHCLLFQMLFSFCGHAQNAMATDPQVPAGNTSLGTQVQNLYLSQPYTTCLVRNLNSIANISFTQNESSTQEENRTFFMHKHLVIMEYKKTNNKLLCRIDPKFVLILSSDSYIWADTCRSWSHRSLAVCSESSFFTIIIHLHTQRQNCSNLG